jgi:hypothetical protein
VALLGDDRVYFYLPGVHKMPTSTKIPYFKQNK